MKRKLLNLLSVPFFTSVLFAPAPEAFSYSIEAQTGPKKAESLVYDLGNGRGTNSHLSQSQGLVQKAQTSETMEPIDVATASQMPEPKPQSVAMATDDAHNLLKGIFVILLLFGYVLGGLQYRKHRTHRATVLAQQVELLERIWKMTPQRNDRHGE